MRMLSLICTLLVVGSTAIIARGADLSKIDRAIAKEPVYKGKPEYCLLVFGPEARTRVWLVQDGDVLYVDRNGNGDLTEEGEQVRPKSTADNYLLFEAGSVSDGKLTHTELTVARSRPSEKSVDDEREWRRVQAQKGGPWTWVVRVQAERPADDVRKLPRRIGYVANGDPGG